MTLKTGVVLGAGNRGNVYGRYALEHPEELRIVAVAEPNLERRNAFARKHGIPQEACFDSWEALIASGKRADVLFNALMDQMHIESTLAALEQGYEVLLEKPIAHTLAGCVRLIQTAERLGRLLIISHILRYSPFFTTLHDILQSGRLGDLTNIEHHISVSYWHMVHSYVRGNWRNVATSGPIALTKMTHDLDILYWLLGQPIEWLTSFGALRHFKPEKMPQPDVPERCMDNCPVSKTCIYYAPRLYDIPLNATTRWWQKITLAYSDTERLEVLKTSDYGRCVYHCDNDVVDHQVINMETKDGVTISLSMNGHGHEDNRSLRLDGAKATLYGNVAYLKDSFTLYDHITGMAEFIPIIDKSKAGYGGADAAMIKSFLDAMDGIWDEKLTSARASMESHLLAFAAEESRLSRTVVSMDDFRERAEQLGQSSTHPAPASEGEQPQ